MEQRLKSWLFSEWLLVHGCVGHAVAPALCDRAAGAGVRPSPQPSLQGALLLSDSIWLEFCRQATPEECAERGAGDGDPLQTRHDIGIPWLREAWMAEGDLSRLSMASALTAPSKVTDGSSPSPWGMGFSIHVAFPFISLCSSAETLLF